MILLHIIFGLMAALGALAFGIAFRRERARYTKGQKAHFLLTCLGALGSTALGFGSMLENPLLLSLFLLVAVLVTVWFCVWPVKKTLQEMEVAQEELVMETIQAEHHETDLDQKQQSYHNL